MVPLDMAWLDVAIQPTVDGLKNHPDMGSHSRLLSAGKASDISFSTFFIGFSL